MWSPEERLDSGRMTGTGPGSSERALQNKGDGIKDTSTEQPPCIRHHAGSCRIQNSSFLRRETGRNGGKWGQERAQIPQRAQVGGKCVRNGRKAQDNAG